MHTYILTIKVRVRQMLQFTCLSSTDILNKMYEIAKKRETFTLHQRQITFENSVTFKEISA